MSNEMETRTVNAPRTGTKVSLIVAAGFLAVAVYYFVSSTHFTGKDGGIFGCGSPMSPNTASLGKDQCHIVESESLHKALLFLALALISAILGTLLFGMEKSEQRRRARPRLDDEDDSAHGVHDDHDDESERDGVRRSGLLAGRQERRSTPRHGADSSRRSRLSGDDDIEEPRRRRYDDEDDYDEVAERSPRRGASPRREARATEHEDDRVAETDRTTRRGSRYDADAFEDTTD